MFHCHVNTRSDTTFLQKYASIAFRGWGSAACRSVTGSKASESFHNIPSMWWVQIIHFIFVQTFFNMSFNRKVSIFLGVPPRMEYSIGWTPGPLGPPGTPRCNSESQWCCASKSDGCVQPWQHKEIQRKSQGGGLPIYITWFINPWASIWVQYIYQSQMSSANGWILFWNHSTLRYSKQRFPRCGDPHADRSTGWFLPQLRP